MNIKFYCSNSKLLGFKQNNSKIRLICRLIQRLIRYSGAPQFAQRWLIVWLPFNYSPDTEPVPWNVSEYIKKRIYLSNVSTYNVIRLTFTFVSISCVVVVILCRKVCSQVKGAWTLSINKSKFLRVLDRFLIFKTST